MTSNPPLSVVVPLYNEDAGVAQFLSDLKSVLQKIEPRAEIIFIDDGSTDGTWNVLRGMASVTPKIQALRLSRRYGKEAAICAGLEAALGERVAVMDGDGQHPPALLEEMLKLSRENGVAIVEAVKKMPFSWRPRLAASRLFNRALSRWMDIPLHGATDFKLLSRPALEAWRRLPERSPFFRGTSAWIGFTRQSVFFEPPQRPGGDSRWTWGALFGLAISACTAYTAAPLHFLFGIGFAFSLGALLMAAQTLWMKWNGYAVDGFTTIILLQLIIGTCIMMGLGVIGLYISRLYEEAKQRPRYIVMERL